MALPTGAGSQLSLAITLADILKKAAELKQLAIDTKARLAAAQNTPGTEVFALCVELVLIKLYLEIRTQAPGLREYAKTVFDDDTLEIVTEYQTMRTALNAVIATIDTQTPSALSTAIYTAGNTAAFRTQLQTLIDTID